MAQARKNQTLILGYITVFLDIMGYYLIVPILPYLSKSLGGTATEEGILFSGYSVAQIASGSFGSAFTRRSPPHGKLQRSLW